MLLLLGLFAAFIHRPSTCDADILEQYAYHDIRLSCCIAFVVGAAVVRVRAHITHVGFQWPWSKHQKWWVHANMYMWCKWAIAPNDHLQYLCFASLAAWESNMYPFDVSWPKPVIKIYSKIAFVVSWTPEIVGTYLILLKSKGCAC